MTTRSRAHHIVAAHWAARFALRLMELRPDMSLRNAVARGAVAEALATGLSPEDAAHVDASEAALPVWATPPDTPVPAEIESTV
ncbi:MAG TPA: hypothetical protein VGM74_03325 [Burkholderiaceae bacterium]|jgi:hypothetical protein